MPITAKKEQKWQLLPIFNQNHHATWLHNSHFGNTFKKITKAKPALRIKRIKHKHILQPVLPRLNKISSLNQTLLTFKRANNKFRQHFLHTQESGWLQICT